jgi:hypothetical protein
LIFKGLKLNQFIKAVVICTCFLVSGVASAVNEQLKGQIRITSFKALGHPDLPSIYLPPDFYLRNQLNSLLSNNGYLFSNSERPVNLEVEIRRFDWDNTFGTFAVDLTVSYTFLVSGVSKTFMTTSSAKASIGQITWGPDRSKFVMQKVSEDSVNKIQNFLELFELPKVEPVEKAKEDIVTIPVVTPPLEEVQKQVTSTPPNQNISAPPESERLSFEASKRKCTELGFKPATEGHGKCVLQLSK